MQIKNLSLTHLGRFKELSLDFAPADAVSSNVTVLIGNNGSGKTSILKSIATALSWYVARLRSEKGSGSPIPDYVVNNAAGSASIEVLLEDSNEIYKFILARTQKGRRAEISSVLQDATRLAKKYRHALTDFPETNLPLIAFYAVERVVLDIPLKIRGSHSFDQIDGYDNSLNMGVDFRRFFEWFREREDVENEITMPLDVRKELEGALSMDAWVEVQKLLAIKADKQLTAVRTAIHSFLPEFDNLRVRRKPRLHMSVDKGDERLNILQLSQGEKSLMALVGDIARRLAIMNPSLDNPLTGSGIVLIDEIDMHLHPKWQRNIVQRLVDTFPNCQFILTTHSPLVISDYQDVLVYALEDGEVRQIRSLYGEDSNTVLIDAMDTHERKESVAVKLGDVFSAIQQANSAEHLMAAKGMLESLQAVLPEQHVELIKARFLLRKQELKLEKNR